MSLFILFLGAIFVNNFIFSKFLGICPFLGVSKKVETAAGMGVAVIFVITLASAATWVVYNLVLVKLGLEYLYNIAFILIIASLVQFVEMFIKKSSPSLSGTWCLSSTYYNKLCCTRCCRFKYG